MRQLFLLRHAKSNWDDPALDDFERPLNERGRKAAKAMAKVLAKTLPRPGLVLCSAAQRTRATYELLGPWLEGVPLSVERDLYEAGKHDLMERLRLLDGHLTSALVIGHNPGLGRLASALAEGHGEAEALAQLDHKFPTGAVAVLETAITHWPQLDDGTCRLSRFIRPADVIG